MTFKEFYRRAIELLPNDSVSVDVEAWFRCEGRQETIEWRVFSNRLGHSYCGPTPEQAIALLETALAPPSLPKADHLDSVTV